MNSKPFPKINPIWALSFSLLFVVVYRMFGYIGHYGYDDMQYAEIAANMLNGNIDYDDHFSFRTTIVYATALSYKCFGINDFASSLPAMVLMAGILILVYFLLREKGFWATTLGLVFTLTAPCLLSYSNKLMPDIYVAFFVLLALYAYYRCRYFSNAQTIGNAILFAFSLLLGFMSKGTIVLILPWLVYIFVADVVARNNKKFWIYSIACGALCLLTYFICIKSTTGEMLYRFKSIAQNSYLNTCSYDQEPLGILLKRLFVDFFGMSVDSVIILPFLFVFPCFVSKNVRTMFKMSTPFDFFAVTSLILFLSCNFMTISATSYVPMCIDARHYLFLSPIVAIAATFVIDKGMAKKQLSVFAVLMAIATAYSFFEAKKDNVKVYLLIGVLYVVLAFFAERSGSRKWWMPLLFVASMFIYPVKSTIGAMNYEYSERRDLLIEKVVTSKSPIVVSDMVATRMMRYYSGFSSKKQFLSFEEFESMQQRNVPYTLVINYHTLCLEGMSYSDLPYFASRVFASEVPDIDKYGVKIYELDSVTCFIQQYDTLFTTVNDFEMPDKKYWNNNAEISQETSNSGISSNRVKMYSATFEYPIDSLDCIDGDTICVRVSAECNKYADTDCSVVFSVENQVSNFSWNSSEVKGDFRAYSHWFNFSHDQELSLSRVPSDAVIKVYFYKSDKSKFFIDDFSVSICSKVD